MVQRDILVSNSLGIHARPASMIVQTAVKFKSNIQIIKDDANADAKSIMSVMILAATYNSTVTIKATGPDEEDAVNAIVSLFEQKFKEE